MANGLVARSSPGCRTICLPIGQDEYRQAVDSPERFRELLDRCFAEMPELFPPNFSQGFRMKDGRPSTKAGIRLRRIALRDGTCYSVRPSFWMPYLAGRTDEVEPVLFLRTFGVPFWALAYVFGRDPMYWYRLEIALGRPSIVGTTCRRADVPQDLLADEHHQDRDGEKNYIATTVGKGCCLAAAVSQGAGSDDLTQAYGVFRQEARDVDPDYAPKTVNTDGWKGTQAAWKTLFPLIVVLQCFLHAWLKIRERAKHLKDLYGEIGEKVWDAYHAPDRRSFSQRLRSLKDWASKSLSGVVLEKVLDLCQKRDLWKVAYDHPKGHRTSNMLDRLMRAMNRYFFDGQHLHGSLQACDQHCRAWALLFNFAPWSPATTRDNDGWSSPAERLNKHRYHHSWLQNLLASASLGGFRGAPQNP